MGSSEYAMVQELALLVCGNIYNKELILSVEDAFVDFLQDNKSSKEVLELEPMNSYHRHLTHQLADIFGFSHHSVGEEMNRHIVVERGPETSIPSFLVRDLLLKYGELKFLNKRSKYQEYEDEDGPEVEKLAFTVRDNLSCKHLILSMEEAFINFIQDDTSSNGVLELKPMDPYCRHLIHRLSDIFGLSHHSEGEGDDRHLIVEQCPETSIPPVLVRDVLREYGEVLSPWNFELLPRKQESAGSPQVGNPEAFIPTSLEEKEAAYLVARQRIFSTDGNTIGSMTERPKTDLEVARRMIGHALGQRIRPSSGGEVMDGVKEEEGAETKMPVGETSVGTLSEVKSEGKMGNEDLIKEQHMGAARRLFANALGVPRDGNLPKRSIESKKTNVFRVKEEEDESKQAYKAFRIKEEEESKQANNAPFRIKEEEGSPQVGNPEAFIPTSLEEKEAAYLAARQRIFSTDGNTIGSKTERPKIDLEVARRMIGHTLGQRIRPSSGGEVMDGVMEEEGAETKMPMGDTSVGTLSDVKSEGKMGNEDLIKEQHMGVARRLFANSLGVPRDGNLPKRSIESKQTNAFRIKEEEKESKQTKAFRVKEEEEESKQANNAFRVKEEEGMLSDC